METQSICFTCVHAEKCVNYQNAKNPIWYCEEFQLPPVEKGDPLENAKEHIIENMDKTDNGGI